MGEKVNGMMTEEVYLKDYNSFVQIDQKYYGGDQDWLHESNQISKFWADRSCGVIAASNVLYHMSEIEQRPITKKDYITFATSVYRSIRPRVYGIPTVSMMKRRLGKLANANNVKLTTYSLINPTNTRETVDYIKEGLRQNCPIMLVTWKTHIHDLVYHWVNITGYYKTLDNKHYAVLSNYGKRDVISIDQWVEEWSIYKGLLYFTQNKLEGL